jgi:hypothetical protein
MKFCQGRLHRWSGKICLRAEKIRSQMKKSSCVRTWKQRDDLIVCTLTRWTGVRTNVVKNEMGSMWAVKWVEDRSWSMLCTVVMNLCLLWTKGILGKHLYGESNSLFLLFYGLVVQRRIQYLWELVCVWMYWYWLGQGQWCQCWITVISAHPQSE